MMLLLNFFKFFVITSNQQLSTSYVVFPINSTDNDTLPYLNVTSDLNYPTVTENYTNFLEDEIANMSGTIMNTVSFIETTAFRNDETQKPPTVENTYPAKYATQMNRQTTTETYLESTVETVDRNVASPKRPYVETTLPGNAVTPISRAFREPSSEVCSGEKCNGNVDYGATTAIVLEEGTSEASGSAGPQPDEGPEETSSSTREATPGSSSTTATPGTTSAVERVFSAATPRGGVAKLHRGSSVVSSGSSEVKISPHPMAPHSKTFGKIRYVNETSRRPSDPIGSLRLHLDAHSGGSARVRDDSAARVGTSVDGGDAPNKEIPWPVKREAVVEGDLILGGLMMVHEREDTVMCGPVMPQGGIQALEAMLYTLDRLNLAEEKLLPNITLGAHILDDCDKDTYGLEMAVDFIKALSLATNLTDPAPDANGVGL